MRTADLHTSRMNYQPTRDGSGLILVRPKVWQQDLIIRLLLYLLT